MMTKKVDGLTEMETKVLETLIDMLYAEPGFSDVDAKDLSANTGISMKSIRGVISSLAQKGYVIIDGWDGVYNLIYLSADHYDLHPVWCNEQE